MTNTSCFEGREKSRIQPDVWLRTLLAIVGDKEKKREVVQRVSRATGVPPEKVEVIIATTIGILINQTRAN